MTHCYTDFLLLCALGTARKNEALADALTNTDALLCGCLTEDTLIHGLTVLQCRSFRAGRCIPCRARRERRNYGRTAPRRVRHCTQPPAPRRRSERGLRRCAVDHGRPL